MDMPSLILNKVLHSIIFPDIEVFDADTDIAVSVSV